MSMIVSCIRHNISSGQSFEDASETHPINYRVSYIARAANTIVTFCRIGSD